MDTLKYYYYDSNVLSNKRCFFIIKWLLLLSRNSWYIPDSCMNSVRWVDV
jgi:hypothetical protein